MARSAEDDANYAVLEKRRSTFKYLRRANEGSVHWFNTVLLSREDLDAALAVGKVGGQCASVCGRALKSQTAAYRTTGPPRSISCRSPGNVELRRLPAQLSRAHDRV